MLSAVTGRLWLIATVLVAFCTQNCGILSEHLCLRKEYNIRETEGREALQIMFRVRYAPFAEWVAATRMKSLVVAP